MSDNRIGQWFVDATDPRKWYGPVTAQGAGAVYGRDCWAGDTEWAISYGDIDSRGYIRITPKPVLPRGLRTRECRLPKKDERYAGFYEDICYTREDWIAITAGGDIYGWRRWIIEDDPDAKPASQAREMAQYDDDLPLTGDTMSDYAYGRLSKSDTEIANLTRERDEARAACAGWNEVVETIRDTVLHERGPMAEMDFGSDRINAVLAVIDEATPDVNPGYDLCAELDQLRAECRNTQASVMDRLIKNSPADAGASQGADDKRKRIRKIIFSFFLQIWQRIRIIKE